MTIKQAAKFSFLSGLMLLILAMVWGGSFFFAEIALREVAPLTIVLHRVVWAIPVLLGLIVWQGHRLPKSPKTWFCFLVMGALNNAIPFSLIFWGQTSLSSGLASILNCMTAFFGVLVAGIFLADENLTVAKIVGALLGVFGVAVIIGVDVLVDFNVKNLAQLAILLAALSYASAGVWGKLFLSKNPPIVNACGMLMGSTVLMFPVVLWVDGVPDFSLSSSVWFSLLGIALLSTAVAYLLYFEILQRAGSANLMLVTLLIPPVAVGLGVGFLGETLATQAWLGFLFIALGLVVTDGRLFRKLAKISD